MTSATKQNNTKIKREKQKTNKTSKKTRQNKSYLNWINYSCDQMGSNSKGLSPSYLYLSGNGGNE